MGMDDLSVVCGSGMTLRNYRKTWLRKCERCAAKRMEGTCPQSPWCAVCEAAHVESCSRGFAQVLCRALLKHWQMNCMDVMIGMTGGNHK